MPVPGPEPGPMCRRLRESDVELLAGLFESNNKPDVTRTFHPFPLTRETARDLLRPRPDRFYGAFLRGEMVGFSMLRGWEEGFSVPSFGILVDHRHQGQGIARELMRFLIDEARRLACERVRLTVYASNEVAVRMFRAAGFRDHSREPVSLNGKPDEKIVMFLELR